MRLCKSPVTVKRRTIVDFDSKRLAIGVRLTTSIELPRSTDERAAGGATDFAADADIAPKRDGESASEWE